jgi:transcriptional regulator with XRE-family HTH domain
MDTHPGQRVRQARLEQHLSVRQLSMKSGVARHRIAAIEAGQGTHFDHTLAKLATALGIELDELGVAS